jgi:hypothetical protein
VNFLRITARIAFSHKRVSLETIMEEVQKNCPADLGDVGKFLGSA